jgi:hypothetical protein
MSFEQFLATEIDVSIGRFPDSDAHRRVHPPVHGGPKQDDPHRWNSREPGPPSILEDRVFQFVRGPEDRPLDHPPLPNVLCQ